MILTNYYGAGKDLQMEDNIAKHWLIYEMLKRWNTEFDDLEVFGKMYHRARLIVDSHFYNPTWLLAHTEDITKHSVQGSDTSDK